jgi:hypothetical protein
MPLNNPIPGASHPAEFQMSALPWATSSVLTTAATRFSFPFVSRFVTINNLGGGSQLIRAGFTQNGVNANPPTSASYLLLSGGQGPQTFELRVTELWVRSDTASAVSASFVAGLTTIQPSFLPVVSGSVLNVG